MAGHPCPGARTCPRPRSPLPRQAGFRAEPPGRRQTHVLPPPGRGLCVCPSSLCPSRAVPAAGGAPYSLGVAGQVRDGRTGGVGRKMQGRVMGVGARPGARPGVWQRGGPPRVPWPGGCSEAAPSCQALEAKRGQRMQAVGQGTAGCPGAGGREGQAESSVSPPCGGGSWEPRPAPGAGRPGGAGRCPLQEVMWPVWPAPPRVCETHQDGSAGPWRPDGHLL